MLMIIFQFVVASSSNKCRIELLNDEIEFKDEDWGKKKKRLMKSRYLFELKINFKTQLDI